MLKETHPKTSCPNEENLSDSLCVVLSDGQACGQWKSGKYVDGCAALASWRIRKEEGKWLCRV